MLKGFKYRLSPTREQAVLINKHIGSVRFIFNLALETKQMAYIGNRINLDCFSLIKQLPDLKNECTWLKEINSQSLQQPIRNLDNAFTKFFKGQAGFPKFKKKKNGGSFTVPQNISIKNGKIFIPKFKEGIEAIFHRAIKGDIKHATISKTASGKYFVSLLCETNEKNNPPHKITEKTTIGIDLGIKVFIATSNGDKIENPSFLSKSINKLNFTQKKYSKYRGKRTRKRLAILHEKVANQRRNFLHTISKHFINNHDSIAIENLKISNMLKNKRLSKSISDCGWAMFIEMLEYKAEWYGRNILKIGTFDPSSKTCSNCGSINNALTLQVRTWTCSCGAILDRDVNAAINIKSFALRKHVSGIETKNRNELPTLVGVKTSEVPSFKMKR